VEKMRSGNTVFTDPSLKVDIHCKHLLLISEIENYLSPKADHVEDESYLEDVIPEKDEEYIDDTQGDCTDIKRDLTLLAFSQQQSQMKSVIHTSNKYVN
jgi:hypothetical protein